MYDGLAQGIGRQPVNPVKINWQHPLTRGLVFFSFGRKNYVDGTVGYPVGTYGTNSQIGVNQEGYLWDSLSTTNGGIGFYAPSVYRANGKTEYTIGCKIAVDTSTSFSKAILIPNDFTNWADPFISIALAKNSGNDRYETAYNSGGTDYAISGSVSLTPFDISTPQVVIATRRDLAVDFYVDGLRTEGNTLPGGTTNTITSPWVFMLSRNDAATGEGTDGRVWWGAIWDRRLNAKEIYDISTNPYQIFELEHPEVLIQAVVLSYLRPDADLADGTWLNESGNNTNLYASIDETSVNDADYIISAANPTNDICRVGLSNPIVSVDTAQAVTVTYRYKKSGSSTINLIVRLKENNITRATWTHNGITTTWTTQTQTLSAGEKSSITNWNNLELEFDATAV